MLRAKLDGSNTMPLPGKPNCARAGLGVASPRASTSRLVRSDLPPSPPRLDPERQRQLQVISCSFSLGVMCAEPLGPAGEATGRKPRRRPRLAFSGLRGFDLASRLLHRGARHGGEEAQGHGPEAELEQPAAARRLEVAL